MRLTTAQLPGTRTPMFAVSNYLAIRFRPLTLTIYQRLNQTVWHLGLHHYTVTYPQIPGPWTRLIYAYRSKLLKGFRGFFPTPPYIVLRYIGLILNGMKGERKSIVRTQLHASHYLIILCYAINHAPTHSS